MRAPRSSREFAESARPYVKRLVFSETLFARVVAIALLGATGGAFAADAMPDVAQANAAYRRALETDIRAKSEPPSPVSASLLAAMKIDAVQGCQRVDADFVACIVAVDAGMRRGYQAYRFGRDGLTWTLANSVEAAIPAPSLADAQGLIRQRLGEDGARQQDPARKAEFERAAAEATVSAMNSCELDSDSGAVECEVRLRLPDGSEPSAKQRFQLNASTWSLLER